MRQFFLFAFTIMLLSIGCTNQYKVPGNILPKDKMEKVLWDMILADRYSTLVLAKDTTRDLKQESFILYEQVFSIHKITRQEFIKSFKYYLDRPDISKIMLDSLATKANRRREEMYRSPTPP